MTQRAALTELIAKIKAGDLWDADALVIPLEVANLISFALGGNEETDRAELFELAHEGGVTEAISLILSLLPRAWFAVTGPLKDGWYCGVYGYRPFADSHHPTSPARALLIAGLRVYRDTLPEEEA